VFVRLMRPSGAGAPPRKRRGEEAFRYRGGAEGAASITGVVLSPYNGNIVLLDAKDDAPGTPAAE
jgi:hypothetical protein